MQRLFEPISHKRTLKTDYPELQDIDEFDQLDNKEMLLVWYFANVTSPLAKIKSVRNKAQAALDKVWPEQNPPKELKNELLTGMYGEKLRAAIERMGKFDPATRAKAKDMVERIFDNYSMITSVSRDEVAQMEDDEKKAYVDISSKIVKDLPDIVMQVENGYGIKNRGVGEAEVNYMDELMQNE